LVPPGTDPGGSQTVAQSGLANAPAPLIARRENTDPYAHSAFAPREGIAGPMAAFSLNFAPLHSTGDCIQRGAAV
jgi:hypothetical protein